MLIIDLEWLANQ